MPAYRFVAGAFLVMMVLLTLGGGGCSGPGCVVTQPSCDAKTCKGRAVYVAGCNTCVIPVGSTDSCTADNPCGTIEGVSSGLCRDPGDSCQVIPGGAPNGTCLPGMALGERCGYESGVLDHTPCRQGLYCATANANNPNVAEQGNCQVPTATGEGVCVLELQQDEPCNETKVDGEVQQCAPCAPGLTCVDVDLAPCTETTPGACTCRASCKTAADCPCNAAYECGLYPQVPGYCTLCKRVGHACTFQEPCCVPDQSECVNAANEPIAPGETGTCCSTTGGTCATDADCCEGGTCGSNKTCLAAPGGTCGANAECAGALCVCDACGIGYPDQCNTPGGQNCCPYDSMCGGLQHGAGTGCCVSQCEPCVQDSDCCVVSSGQAKSTNSVCEVLSDGVGRCCLPDGAPIGGGTGAGVRQCCSGTANHAETICIPHTSGTLAGCFGESTGCQAPGGNCGTSAECCSCTTGMSMEPCPSSGVCPACP
jgi:hypothetical protein